MKKSVFLVLGFVFYSFVFTLNVNAGFFGDLFEDKKAPLQKAAVPTRKANNPGANFKNRPFVVCRRKGCSELTDRVTDSSIFNQITNLLYVNDKTKVYLCEADENTRICKFNGLKFGMNIGAGTAAVVNMPSLTISSVKFSKNLKSIRFDFLYDVYANGLKSLCTTSKNKLEISRHKQPVIKDNYYTCKFNTDLPVFVSNMYNVDYVDLDYGIMGAYYSVGIDNSYNNDGGQFGYVLFKFKNTDDTIINLKHGECENGVCSEDYKIPDGQYEILPFKEK